MSASAKLADLGAMVRAYPPGKKIRCVIPESAFKGAPPEKGAVVEVREREDVRGGACARGVVVQRAWVVEVELPAEDAAPLVDPDQIAMGGS